MNVTPSKSEVSELCAAKGPKHVDRHHICTGSQGQFNEPQTLQDATKLIIYTYLYLTTLVNTPLLLPYLLSQEPNGDTNDYGRMGLNWIWMDILMMCTLFLSAQRQVLMRILPECSRKPDSTSVSHVFS